MNLTHIRQLLAERGIQLTRSLGQNFLHDQNLLQKIVASAELRPKDRVLEIGPGLGPLTELLVQKAGQVLAIEKDTRLVSVLKERFPSAQWPGLHLVHDDALEYLRRDARAWSSWKMVSNLPYSVASPILVELAQNPKGPERIVATLQIEVAARLVAKAGSPDYGILTLLVQCDYEPAGSFKIPASCFFPEPDVDSACVCLIRRDPPRLQARARETFVHAVKQSFAQRRKMMFKLLKEFWPAPALEKAFALAQLPIQTRAESVTLEQFVRLAESLAPDSVMSEEIFDVVNARDEVVGRMPRAEVHRLGLMHRAVHVLVFNRVGQVFLQKRSLLKDRQPGLWDSSASGHVESGEDYDTCAIRELQEELGLRLADKPQRLFKLAASSETDQEHVWVYRCQAEGPFTLPPEEIETGDWFAPAKVNAWIKEQPQDFASGFRCIWRRLSSDSTS